MKKLFLLMVLASCSPLVSYRDTSVPISTAALFDPARYTGTWHEVARFPVPFEEGCHGVTATYETLPDSTLSVLNICRDNTGAEISRINGTAEITGPGRLKVRFASVPFVAAEYWVLWVDTDYQTAVVGSPAGTSGWILNRDPVIPADKMNAAQEILRFNGYNTSQLVEVSQ